MADRHNSLSPKASRRRHSVRQSARCLLYTSPHNGKGQQRIFLSSSPFEKCSLALSKPKQVSEKTNLLHSPPPRAGCSHLLPIAQ